MVKSVYTFTACNKMLPIFAFLVPLQIVFLEKSFDEQINESDSQPFESETQVRNLLKCWTFFLKIVKYM